MSNLSLQALTRMMPGWEFTIERGPRNKCWLAGRYVRRTDDAALMAAALEPRVLSPLLSPEALDVWLNAYAQGANFHMDMGRRG